MTNLIVSNVISPQLISPQLISPQLIVWATVVLGILGLGMGSMLWAYTGLFRQHILFPQPVMETAASMSQGSVQRFWQGCAAFQARRFRAAVATFTDILQNEPACAEVWQNRGRAQANLGNANLAIADFLAAGDLYAQQGTREQVEQIKQDLQILALRYQVAASSNG